MTTPLHALLERMEKLSSEATEAPWKASKRPIFNDLWIDDPDGDGIFQQNAKAYNPVTKENMERAKADVDFIAAARNALPALIEIVKAQQDALELIVLQQDNFPEDAAENSINFAHEALARVNALASEIMKEGKP